MTVAQTYSPVSDEKVQSILRLIQSATRSRNIKKGINESTKCLSKGIALLVVIACDVEPQEITALLPIICEDKGVSFVHVPSKDALGVACGIDRPIAACTIYYLKGAEPLRLEEKIKEALR
ncbi:NUCLEAR PROTEIN OF THE NHP2/RS6 FAMILY [Encephalitozoon cuniculi GB-M1]|uniref:H/ACA ribonucleoprotein complex subunit 2 n=2 Tax=Encephalitozoon cuniculi TaxID=6035 RepID=Q8SRL0_ENCCU|nr:rRNA processing protein [Encephalitozoon cuniculi GB-M1]AGE96388.1 nuclear protein of the nhp2/rs6 family [Encephalitozoon cuniculi]KMV65770.1 50S ribosomal protein L7Ae [Encephalitozoon cuniculi EcunIII-L]UYI27204.1 putative box C/D snornp and U4 snrnp component SNU13P [Encephalitozoon cuniculi]CAD25578.1 NUCLEAR PROTEIN OF THE NHP2/RS6 FAMILY [Encephalitozoon cuniculi GB-M1]